MHFKNKVVWIGASSGIGKELAIQLSQQTSNSYSDFFRCIAFEEVKQEVQDATVYVLPSRFVGLR
jgi:short-subunit dehydrogenase